MASAHQQLQMAPQSGLELFDKAECVGRGSYGAVYRGVNRQTGEVVALKVIDLDHPDNEDIGEIQREVALLSQLPDAASHNITLYHGCWVAGHELWIAMDYASGGSIRTLMKAGPIEERFSVLIVREVLVALAFLHTQKVIHRDIKAANILLTQTGKIILADFGVAAHLSTNSKRSTFIGTPYWMAPEVITDGKLYDTKADIWSLGITLYEIANGNPPLTQYEPLRAIAMIPRATPPTLEGEWTPAMKEFMALCLTVDPTDRCSAEELTRSKWIRSAARVPTSLLRELIVRYGGWVSAGGVRMSIIDNVAKRDDTFEFDTTRASWIFENEEQFEGLGDEPYNDRTQIGRKSSIVPPPHHPLMRLFDKETEDDPAAALNGYTNQIEIPGMGGGQGWGAAADTLRPNSINIPDFDSGDAVSAFAPASTPWFMASATSVGSTEPDTPFGNFDDDSGPSRFGVAFDNSDPDESAATIQMPSHADASPNTVRPGFASGMSVFNPNPFPKRSRQFSTDSSGSNGPFGDLASGPSFSSYSSSSTLSNQATASSSSTPDSPTSDGWDFGRTDSPDSMTPGRGNVAQSPSLPMLATNARRDHSPQGDRNNASPRSPAGANRMRSNTAPNFESQHKNNASSPQESSPAKNVLSFSSRSPFGGAARPSNQRRPTALNLSESSSNSLDPHSMQIADDNLLTPMPTISPVSPSAAETPTSSGFPFPASTTRSSISQSSVSQSSISRTATARSNSTAATSISDWPRGPSLQPLDYSSLTSRDDIEAQLQVLLQNLGHWLSSADQGMAILAEAC